MSELKAHIQHLANANYEQVKAIREHIHANPELSFEEIETSKFILSKLQEFGIDGAKVVCNTGVVVEIHGTNPKHSLRVLRADIDALPIIEQTNAPYKSQFEGRMHACGHDVHTASLLGAAHILNSTKDKWSGTVRCIFQPGEEKLPGGASLMIKEGVLEGANSIVGQHVFPELEAGHVGFKPGVYMASADEIYITVKGKGGHGAMPHKTVDSVLAASQMVVAMQQIVSRRANPETPTVLSFGKILGMGATNVIPSEVKLEGTFRTFDESWRFKAHELIEQVAKQTCEAMGAQVEVDIKVGYPVLDNDVRVTQESVASAKLFLGEEKVHDLSKRMTAEDFAYYTHEIPGSFYRLGTASSDGKNAFPVHHPMFDIDAKSLITGMGLMAWLGAS